MKKVLIFSLSYYPSHVGGAEVALKEITDRISPADIEFHMICNRYDSRLPKVERIGNVLVHRIGLATHAPTMADLGQFPLRLNKPLFQFLAFWKARELHRAHHYDGIWAMMAHASGVPAGLFKTMFPRVTYILSLQEGDPLPYIEKKMRPIWPFFRRGFTKADALQSISTFLEAWGRRMGFKGKSFVIPNGVDAALFSEAISSRRREELHATLGKKEGDIFLVTTSRLVRKNAIDDCIRALAHLPAHIKFLVLGEGPEEKALKALAEEQGVSRRVQFLGQIPHNELPAYLQVSEIFLRPSRSEGMGNSFIEAMAAGIPVIATQVGGIADFLFDAARNPETETTGWAVDAEAPVQIADAVTRILSEPEQVTKVTRRARMLARYKYEWDHIAHEMRALVFSRIQ